MIIMIKLLFISLLSFFLEGVLSIFINMDTCLFNISLVVSFIIFLNSIIKDEYIYYLCAIGIGFLYDIIFTGFIGYSIVSFSLLAIFIKRFRLINICENKLVKYAIYISFYRIISYIILLLIGYKEINLIYLTKGIFSSFFINLMYIYLLSYLYRKKLI